MFMNLLSMATDQIVLLVILGVMVVALIVLPMITNKRRSKAVNELHSSVGVGDTVKTVGGIIGTVIEVRDISPVDKQFVLETGVGDNKTTMVFDIQAVYQVMNKISAPVAAPAVEATATTVEDVPADPYEDKVADKVEDTENEKK